MKKIFCYVASLLVATGAMVGCTEDITTDNLSNEGVNNVEFIEVVASLEADESRTTLLDNGVGKVAWSEGDTIGAILEDGTIEECSATEINGSNAKFSVPATTVYAVYPYASDDKYNAETHELGRILNSNITLDGTNKVFGDKQNVMLASLTDGKLPFKHLCGFIEVKLKGTQVVKHVALRSNTRKWDALSGLTYIKLKTIPELENSFSAGHLAAFNWIYATCNNVELSKEEATSFYFVVPPRTYENLAICVQTENGSYAITSKNAIEVNRAKIRPIAAIDIDALKPATATDLSANGIANCYIIPEGSNAQYYSFPAQKLNATEKLADVAYAHVLWSDRAKLITNVNYDAETGTVQLKYAGGNAEGNAIVSVFDTNHKVLWTWHIWCTDTPEVIAIENVATVNGKIHGMLDRDLGATYAPKTLDDAKNISAENATNAMGLYYQYGRPHPLPKAKSITYAVAESTAFSTNSDFELMYGFYDRLQTFQPTTYANTYENVMTNPLFFPVVDFTDANGTTPGNPETGRYTSFCKGHPLPCKESTKFWHSENADKVSMKGDNDPCPPGYCIDEFNIQVALCHKKTAYTRVKQHDQPNWTYGFYYQCPTTKDIAWHPANGWRYDGGTYSGVGRKVNSWTAIANTTRATRLYAIRWQNTTWACTADTDTMWLGSMNELAYGFGVRCRVMDRTNLQK
ncbi:MAG: hypothetical protein J6Q20_00940 [Alistipes sp.]|nr:hypothetical protein [Alistipes sp.]